MLETPRILFSSSSLSSKKSNNPFPLSLAWAWALDKAGWVLMMKSMSYGKV